ncbi:SpoIIE family protein phosphatase [Streptomyces sp. NPDC001027]|uniref:SpoIIE family protein phosphatase n=1 Tax=Streptomyces sp. NPDC001027 TaxID=3154771 RepID=UPI00331AC9E2
MGAIPTQRETFSRAGGAPARASGLPHTRAILAGSSLAPGAARDLVRAALSEWAGSGLPGAVKLRERLAEDAILVVSELVTNAVVHAGTEVELVCRLDVEPGPSEGGLAVVVEVCDRHPSRTPRDHAPDPPRGMPEHGRGLRLVATLADAWGVTYRRGAKTVWARLLPNAESAEQGSAGGGAARAAEATGRPGGVLGCTAGARAGDPGRDEARGIGHSPDFDPDLRPDVDPDFDPGFDPDFDPDLDSDVALHHGCGHDYGHADFTGLLDALAPEPEPNGRGDPDWLDRGALSFLAEASDLLAGQLDEDLVAALTGQLLVPRLADWCAVWLEDEVSGRGDWTGGPGPRLARVWHGSENRIEELRHALEKDPPCPPDGGPRSGPESYPWPATALGPHGAALAYRLIAGGRPLGTLVLGRAGPGVFPDEVTGLVEDLGRRVALAIGAARQYARQATISAVLQRGLLPGAVAQIPGVCSALVYEPREQGGPSGDFYDLFPAGDGRWCFAVGDVQGKGPEAAVVIGLARPWLRLLAREGYGVADVLDRLNQLLLDDATEAADAAARAFVGPAGPADGPQTRFLSLLYGELAPFEGGIRCILASAGHPLPLLLAPDGAVATAGRPQTLLGVVEDVVYTCDTLELRPGDSLLCVTDGVTERRSGTRQFDDEDGLATALAGCAGLDAELIAERIRRLVHEFGEEPPDDDLALLVLQAL